jgi:ABC-type multidrug transport system ATPase subunit
MLEQKLRSVSLMPVRDHEAGTYSGGMKRRLSVAISSIGDPPLIIMDEPTTGMDPKSVQHVWHMIQELKKNRSILLTTHSMEEAEILADRIAVMNLGEIMCIGTSLHLKNKYGDGYRLSVSVKPGAATAIIDFINENLPSARLVSKTGDLLVFSLPYQETLAPTGLDIDHDSLEADTENVPQNLQGVIQLLRTFEDYIKEHPNLVLEWGISMPTLEAVFHRVTDQRKDFAKAEASRTDS